MHEPQELLGTTQPGQLVAVQGVEADLSRADGGDELLLLLWRCLMQIGIDSPENLRVPFEPCTLRIARRLVHQLKRGLDILPLTLEHVGLTMRVTDVNVRMRQQENRGLAARFEHCDPLGNGLAAQVNRHTQRLLSLDHGAVEGEAVGAENEMSRFWFLPVHAQKEIGGHPIRIIDIDGKGLSEPAALLENDRLRVARRCPCRKAFRPPHRS